MRRCYGESLSAPSKQPPQTTQFIATARRDLPDLLAEVTQLRKAIAKHREQSSQERSLSNADVELYPVLDTS
jgi:hypothetical protein